MDTIRFWVCFDERDKQVWEDLLVEFYAYILPPEISKDLSKSDISFRHLSSESDIDSVNPNDLLILICSPNSSQSNTFNQLVESFLSINQNVLAIISDGVPNARNAEENECFPIVMRECSQNIESNIIEPIAANLKENRNLAIQKLISAIFNIPLRRITHRKNFTKVYFKTTIIFFVIITLFHCTSIYLDDRKELMGEGREHIDILDVIK